MTNSGRENFAMKDPNQKVTQKDADIAAQMSINAPDVDTFMVVQEHRNHKEFGKLAPQKGVSCTPEGTTVQFLKLLQDYLTQSKQEMNYVEARRTSDKLKELANHELHRQMNRMESKQRDELIQIETIQRTQF